MWQVINTRKQYDNFLKEYTEHKKPIYNIGDIVFLKDNFIEINDEYIDYDIERYKYDEFKKFLKEPLKVKSIAYELNTNLIYYCFTEIDFYIGEPTLKGSFDIYLNKQKLVYEHLKTYNEFNNKF